MSSHPHSPPAAPPASATPRWLIEGPLVVTSVADWHRQLVEQLHAGSALELDLSAVTAADVFGIQLLIASQRRAAACGFTLRITGLSPAIDEACTSAGIPAAQLITPLA